MYMYCFWRNDCRDGLNKCRHAGVSSMLGKFRACPVFHLVEWALQGIVVNSAQPGVTDAANGREGGDATWRQESLTKIASRDQQRDINKIARRRATGLSTATLWVITSLRYRSCAYTGSTFDWDRYRKIVLLFSVCRFRIISWLYYRTKNIFIYQTL